MKKILIICIFAALPFLCLAQDAPLLKDFYKGVKSMPTSFILNSHVNIMQFNLDDENFDVAAINDKLQALWKTTLKGHVISTSKFKDKVLAIASTDYSSIKRTNNTFKAYLLDPVTGKVLIEKIIYTGTDDYMTFPYVFTGEGNYFKLAVRQSGFERRLHVAMPSVLAVFSVNSYIKQFIETKNLEVIDFNEKLEPVNKISPVITDGSFITINCNKEGDMFIGRLKKGTISIAKYNFGEKTAVAEMSGDIVLKDDRLNELENGIFFTPSKTNSNVLYYSLMFVNPDNKAELGIGKVNFLTGKKQYTGEVFTSDHIKALRKAYVTVNKNFDSPDLGSPKGLNVRAFSEVNNHLIISLSSTGSSSSAINSGGSWISESSILLNNYDADLNLKYQQLIPTSYSIPNRLLLTGYYHNSDKLFIVANHKTGMTSMNPAYCVIDLATGKCDKLTFLSKKKLGMADSSAILWFDNSFVVPLVEVKGLSGGKYDVSLQQNNY